MISNALQTYQKTIMDKLLPVLQKRSKYSYIGFALLCLVAQQTYSFFAVPKYLRKYPCVSVFSMMKSFWTLESNFDRNKRLVNPITDAGNKFYVSQFPLTWTLFITDPVIARVLLMQKENFPKSQTLFDTISESSPIAQFFGKKNVAMSNGHDWKNQRKIMNPAFHKALPIKTFTSVVPDLFEIIDKNPDEFAVIENMKKFSLDVLGLAAFGFDFQSLKGDPVGWTKTYNIILEALFDPWINFVAKIDFLMPYISAKRRRQMKATTEFSAMVDQMADKRRQEILSGEKKHLEESEKDLLTLMIEADIHQGLGTTTIELRQNIHLFFLAGHDTTAHTLSFCLYNLAKNKHVQKRAREEVLDILGDDPIDVAPTADDIKRMDYLYMVIKENLRLSGPVDKLLARVMPEDTNLGGELIPKYTKVSIDISAIHQDPKIWKDPRSFIPERFEKGGEFESHTGMTYMPFSNGARQCIGMNFSLAEQRVLLSMLLKRYEIDIPEDSEHYDQVKYDKPFNFAPQSLKLKFTKRY